MITNVTIKNYKSILDASISLSPFTLLIGANGTGKSNFFQLLRDVSTLKWHSKPNFPKHINHISSKQEFIFTDEQGCAFAVQDEPYQHMLHDGKIHINTTPHDSQHSLLLRLRHISVFFLDPDKAGQQESLASMPFIHEDGSGIVQVLDSLKTGDREDLFDTIESTLGRLVPEIEKVSFIPGQKVKQLQIREKYISQPIPAKLLSDGTRLALLILTILFQERPPSLICFEEIDRGLHPRLFGNIVTLCSAMAAADNMPQIIATTHNPYLLDQFKGNEESVVIAEKKEGQTSFTSLKERLASLAPEGRTLGELWYSGLLGGVPVK